MHAAKKRRLDGSAAFQNKPFRSPLRKATEVQSNNAEQSEKLEVEHDPASSPRPILSASGIPSQISSLSPSVKTRSANPEHKHPQKQRSALSLELANLRQSLDIAQQALEIEASNQDVELRTLIAKWRAVAQELAEEIFADAKEKVNGMGGVRALRRRNEEDHRQWHSYQDNRELCHDTDGNLLAGIEEPSQSKYAEDNGEDEGCFSMEMMLQEMNIDLRIIGYDHKLERWVD
ncbi:hypothetical protein A1O1_07235 [Capronia coronata CBS 617.96]|uniref:Swi5-dependent recombination DNA repair protein 1 n=1 Tax=Capronia coronata CBS 617.96 TaxID=1182541 RepID=W9XSS2_9EURO|nr:uncharacterized protein A1O1_07235 [Capronia coronata CBS 617.96]EXJ83612.1 hypothetical protein A1O1_07235 [Capronia coronata CBS 617.96]